MRELTKEEKKAMEKVMKKNKDKYKADELKKKDKLAVPTKD